MEVLKMLYLPKNSHKFKIFLHNNQVNEYTTCATICDYTIGRYQKT